MILLSSIYVVGYRHNTKKKMCIVGNQKCEHQTNSIHFNHLGELLSRILSHSAFIHFCWRSSCVYCVSVFAQMNLQTTREELRENRDGIKTVLLQYLGCWQIYSERKHSSYHTHPHTAYSLGWLLTTAVVVILGGCSAPRWFDALLFAFHAKKCVCFTFSTVRNHIE